MDEQQQKEFIAANMDSDLQFVLSDNGVSLEGQVAVARRMAACANSGPCETPGPKSEWLAGFRHPSGQSSVACRDCCICFCLGGGPGIHLEGDGNQGRRLGQARALQVHERQAMVRAIEAIYGVLQEAETPSVEYLSLKPEETETNEPVAASLDEVSSKKDSTTSQMQTGLDSTGHIRSTRTKLKAKLPVTTEEYRRVMRVEMNAWLCMAARYKAKAWLHGLTAAPFNRFVDFILGEKVYNIQVPSLLGSIQVGRA